MKSYCIASLTLDDVENVCSEHGITRSEFDEYFIESDLPEIVEKLADDYIDQLFWNSLWAIVEERIKHIKKVR